MYIHEADVETLLWQLLFIWLILFGRDLFLFHGNSPLFHSYECLHWAITNIKFLLLFLLAISRICVLKIFKTWVQIRCQCRNLATERDVLWFMVCLCSRWQISNPEKPFTTERVNPALNGNVIYFIF